MRISLILHIYLAPITIQPEVRADSTLWRLSLASNHTISTLLAQIIDTVLVLAFDCTVFALTIRKTLRQVLEARRMKLQVTFSYLLVRDGSYIYYQRLRAIINLYHSIQVLCISCGSITPETHSVLITPYLAEHW